MCNIFLEFFTDTAYASKYKQFEHVNILTRFNFKLQFKVEVKFLEG